MIYRKRRGRSSTPAGFFQFQSVHNRTVSGHGDGDYIRLRDEFGNEWFGSGERQDDDLLRYRFRDSEGRYISGISDGYGIILRDEKGNTWRGFID